ncbi:hypothetical protein P692DRAFT_20521346 [Suillus brevipes Sb2]|nr:hypothetical protein P692DRAFT_20521346 [Suillus brevipes Sb2]
MLRIVYPSALWFCLLEVSLNSASCSHHDETTKCFPQLVFLVPVSGRLFETGRHIPYHLAAQRVKRHILLRPYL